MSKQCSTTDQEGTLRQRAEIELLKTPANNSDLAADSIKMLHELQVLQIELELQNKVMHQNQTSEELYRSILYTVLDGIYLTDMTGRFIEVNSAYCSMSGYSEQELLTMSISDIEAIESDVEVAKRIEMIKNVGSAQFESRHRRKDGKLFDVEARVSYLAINVGVFVSSIRDVSIRKVSEITLRESEHKYRLMFEHAGDSITIMDLHGNLLAFNPATTDILGYTSDELVTLTTDKIDTRPEVMAANMGMLMETGSYTGETELRRKDGSIFPASVVAKKIVWEGQSAILSTCRDITERKTAEIEHQRLEQEFQQAQKLESLGIMAGGIAHDFNNILQSLLGNIEIAARDIAPDSDAYRHLSNAILSGRQATRLINLMLAYAGKGTIIKKRLNLNELINESLGIMRSAATSAVTIEMSLSEELPHITADNSQIQQVILNMVTNAAESIEHLPGIIKISTGIIECENEQLSKSLLDEKPKPGNFIFLEIRDNGCGMSKETLQRIFEPFFTTKFTGHGLGMSAVMGIVRSHSGAMFVESTLGKGTTFKLLFPESNDVQPFNAEQIISVGERFTPSSYTTHNFTILLVDDEKNVLRTCSRMISLCGYTVITACDGMEAVRKYREQADEIDAVLMDLTMPNMDGITAMNKIRTINPLAKIVLASGFNRDELSFQFAEQSPTGFIRKPYSMSELEEELKGIFR